MTYERVLATHTTNPPEPHEFSGDQMIMDDKIPEHNPANGLCMSISDPRAAASTNDQMRYLSVFPTELIRSPNAS